MGIDVRENVQKDVSKNVLQETNLNNEVKVTPTCQVCLQPVHIIMKFYQRYNRAFQPKELPKILNALQLTYVDQDVWLLDFGALAHMLCNSFNFLNLQNYITLDSIMIGNGQLFLITHIRAISFDTSIGPITLKNMLYVPKFK